MSLLRAPDVSTLLFRAHAWKLIVLYFRLGELSLDFLLEVGKLDLDLRIDVSLFLEWAAR